MKQVRLGKTGLMVSKPAFGALPVQRVSMEEAKKILRRAYDEGINFFDTANAYTDSEKKLGEALHDVRHHIVIATKSGARDKKTVMEHIENSLRNLRTDYIDIFQFHNPAQLPDPNDPDGPYAAALEAKQKGYIRHIGITNHRLKLAMQALETGWFETMQFPFSYLATEDEIALVNRCKELDIGFIAMKGLSGGLLNNAHACHLFMEQYDNVAPIWGIQRMEELEEFLSLAQGSSEMTDDVRALMEKDKKELAGNFCRGCGYCMPCPVGIEINNSARMAMLLRRAPYQEYMTDEWHEKMHRIENCIQCGQCKAHCPYGLDTPNLLKAMLKDYDEFYAQHKNV